MSDFETLLKGLAQLKLAFDELDIAPPEYIILKDRWEGARAREVFQPSSIMGLNPENIIRIGKATFSGYQVYGMKIVWPV